MKAGADILSQVQSLLRTQQHVVFLDTIRHDHNNSRSLLFSDALGTITCKPGDNISQFFSQIEQQLAKGYYLAGWMSYEFGLLFEEKLAPLLQSTKYRRSKLAEFGIFSKPKELDGSWKDPQVLSTTATEHLQGHPFSIKGVEPNLDYSRYARDIAAIKEYIAAGDTYQVNYTLKLKFAFSGSPLAFYSALRANQSVSYGGFLQFGDTKLLCLSPELFFRKRDDKITMRPMKGTLKKGYTSNETASQAMLLQNDPKNRSENVMIVDLLRNDLGRMVHTLPGGQVQVEKLFEVEDYETLLQMTSTVSATAEPLAMQTLAMEKIFGALYPCGSITGAPKIRTMQIIDELEKEERGVYTGAIGFIGPDRRAVFNVPIRTVLLDGEEGEMGIGSGIVHDSRTEDEWRECLLKANFLTTKTVDFQIIATILWRREGGLFLLEYHVQRLSDSADYFHFTFDSQSLLKRLEQEIETFTRQPGDFRRLRILLAKDGGLSVSSRSCEEPVSLRLPEKPSVDDHSVLEKITLCPQSIETDSPEFFHKTTRRTLYDHMAVEAKKHGLADICFINGRGELTEGCISNIIIFVDNVYKTPLVSSGLLAGVMRRYLLEESATEIVETVLTPDDLKRAESVFLCNGIRGVRQVRLVEAPTDLDCTSVDQ